MPLEYDIQLRNGVTLEGVPNDPHDCYLLQTVDGLDDRELRDDTEARPGTDGDILGVQTESGIQLIVTGWIVARNRERLRAKDRALRAAMAPGDATWPVTLSGRVGDGQVLQAMMRKGGPYRSTDSAVDGALHAKAFQLAVRSASSVWEAFGPAKQLTVSPQTLGGLSWPLTWPIDWGGSGAAGSTAVNAGDAPAWPVFEVVGPCVVYEIQNATTGEAIRLNSTVGPAQSLIIDTSARSVLIGGTNRYRDVDRADTTWWRIQPGSNEVKLRTSSFEAGAQMLVTWRDTYR